MVEMTHSSVSSPFRVATRCHAVPVSFSSDSEVWKVPQLAEGRTVV